MASPRRARASNSLQILARQPDVQPPILAERGLRVARVPGALALAALRGLQFATLDRLEQVLFVSLALIASSTPGCAAALQSLQALIQPPRFEQDQQSRSEIRLRGTTGAAVRIWTRVSNPNSFGVTLGTLHGTLHLEGSRAATVDFPFGLPLQPQSEEVVPIDLSVDFRDVPGLGQAIARAIARQPIAFELEGTIGVSAGRLGMQTLGPMTWLRGELR